MPETLADARLYFAEQEDSIGEYWSRMGGQPSWRGLRVLDLGFGHGRMSVDIARAGGTVVGVELDPVRVELAGVILRADHPELADQVDFRCIDVADLDPEEPFDAVVSKDTFEHVEDVVGVLEATHRLLVPGGRLYAGFSPLFHSPFGDHERTGMRLPWAHSVLPRRIVLARASRARGADVSSLADLGLNGWTGDQFLDAFARSPFTIESLHINAGDRRGMKLLDVLRTVPLLRRWTTVSIYVVLVADEGPAT